MLLAMLISSFLVPIGFVYGLIKNLLGINKKSLNLALLIDIGGNVCCPELFDDLLITSSINPFGSPYQTLSEVLGIHNQLLTLSKTGQRLVDVLHYVDPYHVEKAIGMNVPEVHLSKWEQAKRFGIVIGVLLLIVALLALGLYFLIF